MAGRAISIVASGVGVMVFGLVMLISTFPDAITDLLALGNADDVVLFWAAVLWFLPIGLVVIAAVCWTLIAKFLDGDE